MDQPYVIVGVGSEPDTGKALTWAADEARSRACSLEIVRAYHLAANLAPWETPTDRILNEELRHAAQARVRRAVQHLQPLYPDVHISEAVVDGDATHVLVDRSQTAAVTVLGSRNLSFAHNLLAGSVSATVAAAAVGPVVVVEGPPAGNTDRRPKVVVGIDGSDVGDEVLSFAFEHASRRHLTLRAIFCWRPNLLADARGGRQVQVPEQGERWLAEAVAGWQEKFPDVTVQRAVIRAHPVAALVAESSAEDLLVIGARRRHARFAPLLGSVSQGVLHHATSPVAVVHQQPVDPQSSAPWVSR